MVSSVLRGPRKQKASKLTLTLEPTWRRVDIMRIVIDDIATHIRKQCVSDGLYDDCALLHAIVDASTVHGSTSCDKTFVGNGCPSTNKKATTTMITLY